MNSPRSISAETREHSPSNQPESSGAFSPATPEEGSASNRSGSVTPLMSSRAGEPHGAHTGLRIVIPPGLPSDGAADMGSDGPPTAPQTAKTQHARPTYPEPHAAPFPDHPMSDPNTAAAVHQLTAQRSAVALLKANVSARRLRESVRGVARPRLLSTVPSSQYVADAPTLTAAAAASSPADGNEELSRRPRTVRARVASFTQLFQSRPRLSGVSAAGGGGQAAATELALGRGVPPRAGSGSSRAVPDAPQRVQSGSSARAAMETSIAATAVVSAPPRSRQEDAHRPLLAGDSREQAGGPPPPGGPTVELSPVESAGEAIGMDRVLEEAAKVKGMRLTWLLAVMSVLVFILFTLIFLLLSFSTDRTIEKSGVHMLRSLTVAATNNAELLRHEVVDTFMVMNNTFDLLLEKNISGLAARELLCTRIYGAPIAMSFYNSTRALEWSFVCDPSSIDLADIPDRLDDACIPSMGTARLVAHTDYALAAYYTDINNDNTAATLAVFLSKAVVGRVLLSNSEASYSTASLQSLNLGVLMPTWTHSRPSIALTTLTTDSPSYSAKQPTQLGRSLQTVFDNICNGGASQYVWHAVVRSGRGPSRNSTENPLPFPRKVGKGAWGVVSRMAMCSALCLSDVSDVCVFANPSAMWFALDSTLMELKQDSSLNLVGAISIVAIVIFTCILLLAYIGISLPVHFLRHQLLSTVGSKRRLSGCQARALRWTRRFWISDLVSLIRAIHVLSLCFRLNKKYVPEHVLRNHANQLYKSKGGHTLLEPYMDETTSNATDDEDDERSPRDSYGDHLEDIHELVATTNLQRESSMHLGLSMTMTRVPSGGVFHLAGIRREESEVYGRTPSLIDPSERRSTSAASPSPMRKRSVAVHEREQDGNSFSGFAEEVPVSVQGSLANQDFILNTASFDLAEVAGGAGGSAVDFRDVLYARPAMEVRRTEDATILCVRILDVDCAYLLDYRVAQKQHRRVMRFLLNRIRHYKGAIFYRTGECLAAAWNAFDSCYNHAEHAAACAQDIASAFAPYREQGLQIGIVLHQGTFVCGTVEDTREAFVTAFGEGPRQAIRLAELAAAQPAFSILITEPVKQTLSAKYECLIVDVIHFPDMVHYLILFELGLPRVAVTAVVDLRASREAGAPQSPHSPVSSSLVVQYAKVFALFRSHEFKAALDGIQTIRQMFVCTERVQRLLDRLELLSTYYRTTDGALPMPYSRAYPTWSNYELVAALEGVPAHVYSPASDVAGEAGVFESPGTRSRASPTSTLAPATRAAVFVEDRGAVGASAAGGGGVTFTLPEVHYDQVLRVSDEEMSFKRELHDNIKRLGTPAQRSPHLWPGREGLLESAASPNSAAASTAHTPSLGAGERRGRSSADSLDNLPPLQALPASTTAVAAADAANAQSAPAAAAESDSPHTCARTTGSHGSPPLPMIGWSARLPTTSNSASTSASASVPRQVMAGAGCEQHVDPTAALVLPAVAMDSESGQEGGTGRGSRGSDTSTEVHYSGAAAMDPQPDGSERVGSVLVDAADDAASALSRAHSTAAVEASHRLHTPSGGPPLSVLSDELPMPCRGLSQRHRGDSRCASFAAQRACSGVFGSFVSNSEAEFNSAVQSVGISLAEADGQFPSMHLCRRELPTQIVGKNGTTYMRSARVLGRGSFGSVYLGMDIHSGKLVAIKFLPMPSDESEISAVEAEVSIMQRVKDSHVVELITYAFERTSIILVIECMMAGSLQNMISAFKVLPSTTAHVFMRDVLRGLNKLHSMGIIHRDVKPQNVLLTLAGNCKISDFGASAWLHELARKEAQGQVLGTPVYLAPEAARGMPVETSDIWSCGIMFLQLITGRLPYPDEQLNLPAPILVYQIGLGDAVPIIPDTLDELDASFVRACLHTNPQDRKTAIQLLQMPLFTL